MSNIVKSNFTSLNGLNNENIDNLVSDTISTNELYVNGSLIVPSQTIGQQCTIVPGLATVLPSGSNPTVTNSGNSVNAIFNFGIPSGLQGIPGNDGIPGKDGIPGNDGNDGQSVSIDSITTTQISPSTTPYIYDNVSTSNNIQHHILSFGVCRGKSAYINLTSINQLNPNASPYCTNTLTTDSNGDNQYTLSFNLPANKIQTFSVNGTNTISYGNLASVTMTTNTDSLGNQSSSFIFSIPQGRPGSGFTNRGTFNINTQYYVNDVVYYYNSSYVCIQNAIYYYPNDDTGVLVNLDHSVQHHTDTAGLYWQYWAHQGPQGLKGDQGNPGDSFSGLAILAGLITGVASGFIVSFLSNAMQALAEFLGLTSPPNPTAQDQTNALAALISNMQEEITALQGEMTQVQTDVVALQEEVTILQAQTEYQSIGETLYNGLHTYTIENYTNFNSGIRLTTSDLFATPPAIHSDGVIECTQIKPSVNNTLVIDGNLYVKGYVYTTNANTGGFQINGIWDF